MANRFLSNIRINDAYTFPASDGTAGQVIGTDGAGNLSFVDQQGADGATLIFLDTFTGDGVTTDFTLSQNVDNEVKTFVYFDGVYQEKDTYEVSTTTITFSTAPPSGTSMEVVIFLSVAAEDYNQKLLFYGKATGAISKGDAVMFAGAEGDHFLFAKATQAAIEADHSLFIGLANQDFVDNEFGYVVEFGRLDQIDTTVYTSAAGTILWFDSEGTVAGAITETEPTPPAAKIQVAAVIRLHQNEGSLFVRPTWYHELGELHDVDITSAADKDLLTYNSSTGVWENSKTLGDITTGNITTSGVVDGVDISDFKTAYDSHNHDDRYYTETEVDTLLTNSTNWDTAYSWGDHAGLYSLLGHTHTESEITDFGNYVTGITHDTVNTKLVVTNRDATTVDLSLAQYVDDTNLARLVSGTVNISTGIATFTRDDATTFDVDFSALLDDTNDYVTSASFNTSNGVLTLTRFGGATVTVNLDDRYLTSAFIEDKGTYTSDLDALTASGDQGWYAWGSTQPTNSPGWNYGGVFVIRDSSQNLQLAFGGSGDNNQRLAVRRADSGSYGPWTEFYSTADFSSTDISNWNTSYSYSQVGHLPLTGGTLNGDLTVNASGLNVAATFISTDNRSSITIQDDDTTAYIGVEDNVLYLNNGATNGIGYANIVAIDSVGRLGVQTSSPLGSIHIYDGSSGQTSPNGVANSLIIEDDTSAGISILTPSTAAGSIFFGDESDNYVGGFRYYHTDDEMSINVNNAEVLRFDSSGNLGLGTPSPGYSIDITKPNPAIELLETASGTSTRFRLQVDSTGTKYITTFGSGGGKQHIWQGGQAEVMRLDNDGNLGIGTDAPTGKLDVRPTDSCNYVFTGTSTSGYTTTFNMDDNALAIGHNSGSRDLYLKTNSLERLTIAGTNGNIGIGTTSPAYKLDVSGDIAALAMYDNDNTAYYIDPAGSSNLNGATLAGNLHLARTSIITFYGNAHADHSISSRGIDWAETDDIRINSYGSVFINLDSNNNNTSLADFRIGRHGGEETISDILLTLNGENGNLTISGDVNAAGGNSGEWNTAYTYSQVGHLPLAGGTMSGDINAGGNKITNLNSIVLNNNETSGLTQDGQIAFDLNDSSAPASLGTYGGSYPDGLYLYGNSTAYTIYHTGHFSGTNIANWETAYGWGNHASAGYLTSLPSHNHDDRYYTETEVNSLLSGKLGTSAKAADSELLDGSNGTYFDHRRYTDSSNYLGGYYVSGGTEKPNSSIFGAGKFKVAMLSGSNLGFGGTWNDVLWMSTYNGGDVKRSTALISSKYDATNLWIAKQNYDSSSWGTGYLIWNSGNDGSGSGLDADLLDGQEGSYYTNAGNLTGTLPDLFDVGTRYNIGLIDGSSSQTRDKIRVWGSSLYTIGMQNGYTYGHLDGYAMSFQMNTTSNRGWWWGHDLHTDAQGAMSLTNNGRLTVATSLSVGEGESVTAPQTSALWVSGDATITTLNIAEYIYHNADTNTYIRLLGDRIQLYAGGVQMIDAIEGTTDYIDFANNTARITSGGSFECTGDIIAYTTTSLSDERQKENIKKIDSPVEKIKQINGYTFNWKHNEASSGGVIAQEVEKVLPEIVKEKSIMDSEPHKTVEYNGLIGLLIETVKELSNKVEELENKLNGTN